MVKQFEDLEVWRLARELTNFTYGCTEMPAFRKDPALADDLRANARSVMNNISEGFDRGSNPQFACFLGFVRGSLGELRGQFVVAHDNGRFDGGSFLEGRQRCEALAQKLNALIRYLRDDIRRQARRRRRKRGSTEGRDDA